MLKYDVIKQPHMRVYWGKNNLLGPRIGVKIYKKYITLAVVRNLIKRRLISSFRTSFQNINLDVIIIISDKIYSKKNEISDILMQEWELCQKSLKKF